MTILNAIFTQNFVIVMSFFGVFVLCVLADIMAKMFYNVNNLHEEFSWQRLFTGLIRMLCVCVSSAILSFVISLVPSLIPMVGIALSDEIVSLFSVATVAGVYLGGIVKYFRSAFETVSKIINNEKVFDIVPEIKKDAKEAE